MSTQIVVPELGESIVEATVARWLKQVGEWVEAGEPVVELETDKVDLEVAAQQAGVLEQIHHEAGADVQVGESLGVLRAAADTAAEAQAPPQPQQAEKAPSVPAAAEGESADVERATPLARRVAEEHGIELRQVEGSGAGGRVTRQDVEAHLKRQAEATPAPAAKPAPRPVPTPPAAQPLSAAVPAAAAAGRSEERVRMSRRRRTIAQRLVEAQQTAAMLTTFNEIDMSAVVELRNRRKQTFAERTGARLGFMSFFVKASLGALKAFPLLNAELDGDEIVIKHYYDVGIAVGAEEGLVVPVLRNADRMSFAQIEESIRTLAKKAQDGQLALEELRGGTFTITNGGVFGSLLSTPILNPPQVAILGMHKIEERPVVVRGEIVVRPMMYVALGYDHRIVDGREAVQFLVRLKELVEDPETLLLEG